MSNPGPIDVTGRLSHRLPSVTCVAALPSRGIVTVELHVHWPASYICNIVTARHGRGCRSCPCCSRFCFVAVMTSRSILAGLAENRRKCHKHTSAPRIERGGRRETRDTRGERRGWNSSHCVLEISEMHGRHAEDGAKVLRVWFRSQRHIHAQVVDVVLHWRMVVSERVALLCGCAAALAMDHRGSGV